MNQLFAEPVLLLAMLVMVSLALIPRRYPRVLAVLGWALMWLDNEISGHWSDWLGAAVVIAGLGMLVSAHRLRRRAPDRHGRAG